MLGQILRRKQHLKVSVGQQFPTFFCSCGSPAGPLQRGIRYSLKGKNKTKYHYHRHCHHHSAQEISAGLDNSPLTFYNDIILHLRNCVSDKNLFVNQYVPKHHKMFRLNPSIAVNEACSKMLSIHFQMQTMRLGICHSERLEFHMALSFHQGFLLISIPTSCCRQSGGVSICFYTQGFHL